MKLKSIYKSFTSSVKKTILKLKEKVVLCTKQSKLTTQTDNKLIDNPIKEIVVNPVISLNCIDFLFTRNRSIQKEKNTITKWFYSVITIKKAMKLKFLISTFNPPPKYNIQTHFI